MGSNQARNPVRLLRDYQDLYRRLLAWGAGQAARQSSHYIKNSQAVLGTDQTTARERASGGGVARAQAPIDEFLAKKGASEAAREMATSDATGDRAHPLTSQQELDLRNDEAEFRVQAAVRWMNAEYGSIRDSISDCLKSAICAVEEVEPRLSRFDDRLLILHLGGAPIFDQNMIQDGMRQFSREAREKALSILHRSLHPKPSNPLNAFPAPITHWEKWDRFVNILRGKLEDEEINRLMGGGDWRKALVDGVRNQFGRPGPDWPRLAYEHSRGNCLPDLAMERIEMLTRLFQDALKYSIDAEPLADEKRLCARIRQLKNSIDDDLQGLLDAQRIPTEREIEEALKALPSADDEKIRRYLKSLERVPFPSPQPSQRVGQVAKEIEESGLANKCWFTLVVLYGSLIESLLVHYVENCVQLDRDRVQDLFAESLSKLKNRTLYEQAEKPSAWRLERLIYVAGDLAGLTDEQREALHVARDARNCIHLYKKGHKENPTVETMAVTSGRAFVFCRGLVEPKV